MISLRKSVALAIAGITLAANASATAQVNSTTRMLSYPPDGVQLGNGWNSQGVQKTAAVCIEFDTAQSQSGQETTMERTLVSDQYSYSNALNVSADVQVKAVSGASVDAKANYSKKKQIDSSSMYLVEMATVYNGWVYAAPKGATSGGQQAPQARALQQERGSLANRSPAEVQRQQQVHQSYSPYFANVNRPRTVKEKDQAFATALQRLYGDTSHTAKAAGTPQQGSQAPNLRGSAPMVGSSMATIRLADDAVALLKSPNGLAEFQRICGDGFVAGIKQGGELAVTYKFTTNSQQQQQDLGATLGVGYGTPVASGNVTVSVAQAVASMHLQAETSVDYYKTGGSGDPIPTTLDQIDGVTQGFAKSVASAPYSYQIIVSDYTQLPNYPTGSPGMPPLAGFDLVAWEFAKAQTLNNTASAIYNDLSKPGTASKYVLARWGYSKNDVLNVASAASARLAEVQAIAKNCFPSGQQTATSNCTIATKYDDLTPRQYFPLPISAGNVGEVMTALWSNEDDYRSIVFNRWVGTLNDNRCYIRPADPSFCRNIGNLESIRSNIKVGKSGAVALEVVDRPGRCLKYDDRGRFISHQPCPSSDSDNTYFFAYDPNSTLLHPVSNTNQCVFTLRNIAPEEPLPVYAPGYGALYLENCDASNAHFQMTRGWKFNGSLDANGKPDNTGVYMVVADVLTSPQNNSCFEVMADAAGNWGPGVAPCSNPSRLRFWKVKAN